MPPLAFFSRQQRRFLQKIREDTKTPHEILPISLVSPINPLRISANASDFTDAAGRKGDVIIVPKGTPHQYTEVSGSFDYFVVKATSSQGG
jgi:hypothetical protein